MVRPPAQSRARLLPIALAQGLGLVCGVAGVKVNSHFIPPAELGVYGVYLTFTPLGLWVVHAGLAKSAGRQWLNAPDRPAFLHALVRVWARRLPWLTAAIAPVALLLGHGVTLTAAGLAGALLVGAALWSLGSLAQILLQAEAAHWRDCAVVAVASLTRTFLPPLLFVASGGIAAALWTGFSLHTVAFVAAGAWWLRRYWRGAVAPDSGGAAAPAVIGEVYEGPLFTVLALASWALAGLNRWLVVWRFGHETAGYFTLGGGAAIVVTSTIGTVWLQYFQPGLYARGDDPHADRPALARRLDLAALLYTGSAGAALALFAFVAPALVGPLIGPAYRPALGWILPAGGFGIATITAVYYHTLLLAGRRERACGPVDLTTAAVLAGGCLAGALAGEEWLRRWLLVTPLVPWLLTRPLARRWFFRPAADRAPAPDR